MELDISPIIRGRRIHELVIPTVCNLGTMLKKLRKNNWDTSSLKQWEKRCYSHFNLAAIHHEIVEQSEDFIITRIRRHIIEEFPAGFGAGCLDIYLIAYVYKNKFKEGDSLREIVFEHLDKHVTTNENSKRAVWQVGRGNGHFLKILGKKGHLADIDFIKSWINAVPSK